VPEAARPQGVTSTRCPGCGYPVPDDRERAGARCPACHDPLYEPAGRHARPAREGEASCAVHAGVESVGACGRCGNYVCETCRTRWRGQVLCAACVDRALAAGESAPAQEREHRRQALASAALGAAAWLVAAAGFFVLSRPAPGGRAGVVVTFVGLSALAADALLAAAAAGAGLAALRAGGGRRGLALAGLVLGASYVGVIVGLGALGLWQN